MKNLIFGKIKKEFLVLFSVIIVMAAYFIVASSDLMDDGNHYEGFTESLAKGKLDFKSFYGFQGLSILSVLIYWLTGSHISIIITSAILYLLSLLLAYLIGRDFYNDRRSGVYFMILILLMPYVYTTMMRGFQEAALLFFILLTIYGAVNKRLWTPIAWAFGGIVKPFNLVLFPLFVKDFFVGKKILWLGAAVLIGIIYLGASYYQTGHLVNNAAIGSYQGNFDAGNPPPLWESFVPGVKGFLRVGANLLSHPRKVMISPFVVVLGVFSLLLNKSLKLRKEIIISIALNFILVGSLTFSFSKYLLPLATLLALVAIPYLQKYKWLMVIVLIDSLFVFLPIWNYFGKNFWSSTYIYLIPFYLAVALYFYAIRNNSSHTNS